MITEQGDFFPCTSARDAPPFSIKEEKPPKKIAVMKTLPQFLGVLAVIGLIALVLPMQAQPTIGVKAGVNVNRIGENFANPEYECATQRQLGFHVGVLANIELGEPVSLMPGVNFTLKGSSYDIEQWYPEADEVNGYDRMRLGYIEVPVNLAVEITEGLRIYAGPYVGLGLMGKNNWDITYKYGGYEETDAGDTKMVFKFGEVDPADLGEDEEPFRALDYGLNGGVILFLGPAFIDAGYTHGLANLTPKYIEGSGMADPADFQKRLRVFRISVGVFLN
jgi:hypothetical protein